MQLNRAVECVEQLTDELDDSTVQNAQGKVDEMKKRWDVVTKRVNDFCSRDLPVSTESIETVCASC